MAGDWILMRHDLGDDPAVRSIARACNISRVAAVGGLWAVWSWFDRHTTDGRAMGETGALIDELTGVEGFARAMETVQWLTVTCDGDRDVVSIPKFRAHMSQSAKTRQLTARRTAKYRERKRDASRDAKSSPQDRTAESEEKTEQKSSAGSAGPSAIGEHRPSGDNAGRAGALPAEEFLKRNAGTAAVRKNRNGPAMLELQGLLGDRGCDVSFRGTVSRFVDPQLVRALAAKYDVKKRSILNPGGWWRDQLRLAGVKGL